MNPLVVPTAQTLVADTLVTIPTRDSIALAADLAVLVSAVAMTVLAVTLLRMLTEWRKALRDLRRTAHASFGPVSDRARSISDNVDFITQALRTDVVRLNASVKSLTDRLHQASDHMEARIDEFNALMEVVQGEAEDIFLDTASTVRGVREGARALGKPRGSAGSPAAPPSEENEARPAPDDPSHTAPEAVEP